MVILLFRKPYENKFPTVSSKQKPPFGGGCFLLDCGADGTVIELFGAGSDASKQFMLTYTHLWGIGYKVRHI
jgi:hypothetical protein